MGLTLLQKMQKRMYFARFVIKLVVEIMINKVVVGSSHRDMPKYVGKGVALCGTPGVLDVPLLQCSCLSMAILGNFGVGVFLQNAFYQFSSTRLFMMLFAGFSAVCWFSCFLSCPARNVHWFGGIVVRGCVSRSLLGSYVHQELI